MTIICESGSTKADWAIAKNIDDINYTETIGINPLFHSAEFIATELAKNPALLAVQAKVSRIFYYGTSCSSPVRNRIVQDGLAKFFPNAQIEVAHDLDGAVFSVATKGKAAIVNILGTGSNSCFYDGEMVSKQIGGNGFIISDEASGAYFGKMLIGDFLIDLIPANMSAYMREELGLTRDSLLDHIYKQPNANVYLAQFTKVLGKFSEEAYVQDLLQKGFSVFIERHIARFPNFQSIPCHFIGSVAYHFQDALKLSCDAYRIPFGQIIQKPLDGLVKMHLQAN